MDFVLPVRVYLEDTDAQGVVYNASYFRFMERARTEWLGARGLDHAVLEREHGLRVVLTRVEAELRAPARLGDLLEVAARVDEARGARIVFRHEIRQGPRGGTAFGSIGESARKSTGEVARKSTGESAGNLICRGLAEVACVDITQGRPRRLPSALLADLIE
jgi:acyl-CoA thioester hydrolase